MGKTENSEPQLCDQWRRIGPDAKPVEMQYHNEICNQLLWNEFGTKSLLKKQNVPALAGRFAFSCKQGKAIPPCLQTC
jgi:hypothetical protein